MIKRPTSAAAAIDVKVSLPADPQTSTTVNGITAVTDSGSGARSRALRQPVTLNPGQSIIYAQADTPSINNFDPGDANAAGQIGADPLLCAAPSKAVPTVTVMGNGKAYPVKDTLQVLNTHGVDAAGCRVPTAGSSTRSDESNPVAGTVVRRWCLGP